MTAAVIINIKPLEHFDVALGLPTFGSDQAAGADICFCAPQGTSQGIVLQPLERALLPTGLSAEIPAGFELQVRPRSGLAFKQGITILNAPGTIDADYRGEIKLLVINLGHSAVELRHGDRIAQLVLNQLPSAQYQWIQGDLTATLRGEQGFGSTGLASHNL